MLIMRISLRGVSMKKTDVLVIGGSATGLVAATTAKSNYPDKSVTVIRKEKKVLIPCGIPYIFGTVGTSDNNILSDEGLVKLGVEIIVDEVIDIDSKAKVCKTQNGLEIGYDKLILGTGSMPLIPRWLKGTGLQNVYTIPKNKEYLDKLYETLNGLRKVIVVGAGFIGVELSDELNKAGKDVTLVEILPHVLGATFDDEFAIEAEALLAQRGVKIKTNIGIEEILGDTKVTYVKLNNGEVLDAEAVILSLGYLPNSEIAKKMGLELNAFGFIKADQYRRTSMPDVFAAGDCAEKIDFSTGKISKVMLASTACTEARIAGLNLYDLNTFATFRGTIGIYSTCIGETAFGVAGLIEKTAAQEGFKIVIGSFTGVDRHPGKIPDAHKETVKLIVSRHSGVLLGGEVMGGKGTGQLINAIGIAVQNHMTINDLLMMQMGTQPLLTASPAGMPLIKAAESVAKALR